VQLFDVVIVGGGPAGLSAALVLGRCIRRVLVCDDGQPRNARSRTLNGYLTRDGVVPLEFLAMARDELRRYDVTLRHATVDDVERAGGEFLVVLRHGERIRARAVLLATGVRDHLPAIDGLEACYGVSVHHCPYCDGWEVRGKAIAVVGQGVSPAGLALSLRTWSARVVACSNGASLRGAHRRQLSAKGIRIQEQAIVAVRHTGGWVRQLALADGSTIDCEAVFFTSGQSQRCDLAARLGCEFTGRGTVKTDRLGQTCVPGIYVVGDASRDVQFVIVAAAEGAKAGVAINKSLQAAAGLTTEQPAAQHVS
jgi:thioredoxin reductase